VVNCTARGKGNINKPKTIMTKTVNMTTSRSMTTAQYHVFDAGAIGDDNVVAGEEGWQTENKPTGIRRYTDYLSQPYENESAAHGITGNKGT
jgi:hypothetical protein